jgi:hypothetical protein
MSMRMGYRILPTLVCTFVFVSIGTAHEIHIGQRAKIGNGQELEQGAYRVEVERNQHSAEVLFFQGEELVAAARATLTKEDVKCNHTEVHSEEVDGQRVITKIWLRGWKESLVFKQDTSEAE